MAESTVHGNLLLKCGHVIPSGSVVRTCEDDEFPTLYECPTCKQMMEVSPAATMHLYLVKRGPLPEYFKAPFHPVIICTRVGVARREAGTTSDLAWVWEQYECSPSDGWDLCRWSGLDLVGGAQHFGYRLPDGTKPGFVHDREREPWTLLAGAVWWSDRKVPTWLEEAGVVYPSDQFTQNRILQDYEWDMPPSKQRRLPRPAFWPVAQTTI